MTPGLHYQYQNLISFKPYVEKYKYLSLQKPFGQKSQTLKQKQLNRKCASKNIQLSLSTVCVSIKPA